MCMQQGTGNRCCKAERVVPGKHKKMGWGKLGGRWKKGWDTGTSTVPWFVGVQKVNT